MDSLGCHPELKRRRSASRLQQTKQLLPRPWNQERLLLFLSRAGVAPDPSLHGILSSFFDDLSVKLLLYIRGTLGGVIRTQPATICFSMLETGAAPVSSASNQERLLISLCMVYCQASSMISASNSFSISEGPLGVSSGPNRRRSASRC